MKNIGIIKKFDELGRILIPIEIRRSIGIKEKDAIDIFLEGENIIINKVNSTEKVFGFIRYVDELGRIVIPIEIRNYLKIVEKCPVEVYLEGNRVILKKHYTKCIYCNEKNNLYNILEKPICDKCVTKIKEEIDKTKSLNNLLK